MFARSCGRAGARLAGQSLRPKVGQTAQARRYASEAASSNAPSPFQQGLRFGALGLACSALGAVAAWQVLSSYGMGFYSDADSLTLYTPAEADAEARKVEETIRSHPVIAQLRERADLTESRPHMKMPAEYRARSLTGGALTGPGKVVVPPFAWNDAHGKEMVAVFYVGEDLCGHPGIVHGGLLATILDEGLGRCCFKSLPHNIAVTANLNVNYRKPTPASSYLVMRAETTKVDGRKAWVKGRLESLVAPGEKPIVFAEADALFISPKYAAVMPRIV